MAELATPIAQPVSRVDGRLKVIGAAKYPAEFAPEGLLYAQLIQSTISRGRVRAIDTSAAKKSPGVIGIFTRADIPPFAPYPEDQTTKGSPGEKRPPLADDEVHFFGQHLGILVADSSQNAAAALAKIRIEYDTAPPALTLENPDALKTATFPEKFVAKEDLQVKRGDVVAALNSAATKLDLTYTTPIENHNPIETYSTIAMWPAPDRLFLFEATRGIKVLQKVLATSLRLPPENIRIVVPFIGGAFGSKGFQWSHILLTAAAARLVGRPVKLHFTRMQMFDSAGQRAHTVQNFSLGADKQGKLVALRHASTMHCSPISEYPEPCGNMSRMLYSCPNVDVSHRLVRLNYTSPCPMRAPGEAPGVYALECAIDELAHKCGIDPVEFRLRNYSDFDEFEKRPYTSKHLRECYTRGAEMFGWSKRKAKPNETKLADGTRVGFGMATSIYPANQRPAEAKAIIGSDGKIVIRSATHEIGTGTYTAMTQFAAAALGVPMDDIHFELGSSDFPPAPSNGGSWQTASVGPAVAGVCNELKNNFSQTFGSWPNESKVRGEFVARSGQPQFEAQFKSEPPKEDREKFSFHSYGAIFTEVHVDVFGQARVKRVAGVYDVGRMINPKLARSQIIGANLFGIGMALMEATIPDPQSGRWVNPNLSEYHVPVNADTPEFAIDFINEPDPHMPDLGARGIGEIGIVGMAAAVANAIFHATGKRVRDLPITPDKLI